MGYNTVAVLYNDFNFAKYPKIGERIAEAMRGWSMRDRDSLARKPAASSADTSG